MAEEEVLDAIAQDEQPEQVFKPSFDDISNSKPLFPGWLVRDADGCLPRLCHGSSFERRLCK